jgi:hypothetical protein
MFYAQQEAPDGALVEKDAADQKKKERNINMQACWSYQLHWFSREI